MYLINLNCIFEQFNIISIRKTFTINILNIERVLIFIFIFIITLISDHGHQIQIIYLFMQSGHQHKALNKYLTL